MASPEVMELDLSAVATRTVRLSWRTNEPARTWVEIGKTEDYGVTVDVSPEPALDHEVEIDGLEEEAEYHLRIACVDAAGNEMRGIDHAFSLPDTSGPAFAGIQISQEGPDRLRVTWRTNEPATSELIYGVTSDLGQATYIGTTSEGGHAELGTEHERELTGLAAGTWFVRLAGRDQYGNAADSPVQVAKLADWVAPVIAGIAAEPLFPTTVRVSWSTDEPASTRIDHGADPSYGTSVYGATPGVAHQLDIPDVEPGGTVYYRVVAIDAAGNERTSEDLSFKLADKVAPVIAGLKTTQVGHSIQFDWTTDEPASARIEYGPTAAYGFVAEGVEGFHDEHSVLIEGLAIGDYHFRVIVKDPASNTTMAPDSTFEIIDTQPPTISNVSAVNLWPGIAIVTWDTDEPASTLVHYGTTPSMGQLVGHPALVEDHNSLLTGLAVGSTYYYQVASTDEDGNTSVGAVKQFLAVDNFPPVVSNLTAAQASQETVSVSWTTDEPSIYLIQYGTSLAFGNLAFDVTSYETSHSTLLDGFDVGTWFVQVVCADAMGNLTFAPVMTVDVQDVTAPKMGPITVLPEWDGVTLAWQTDENAIGRVLYGTTPGYGQVQFEPGAPSKDHVVTISGLAPETEYHFSIISGDVFGNESATPNATFETGEEPNDVELEGTMTKWFPLELTVPGPIAHELDSNPNPFLDYRFTVRFTSPTGKLFVVPGFFAGDGSGGASGDKWRARFSPSEAGEWSYELLFHQGSNIAINMNLNQGAQLAPHGVTGHFLIDPLDSSAEGFYKWGLLEYVGEHYLKFRDGSWFLKGATNSPENLLAYRGFDNTFDQPGGINTELQNGIHRYDAHRDDYVPGDPWFVSEDSNDNSKGLIGVLNYLSSVHVNGVYFLPMNLGGDGREVTPFVGYSGNAFDNTHYDISKLAQWNEVFEHAMRKGILLHFVLNETETANENWLDGGNLGKERKLFYRELVARFSHHIAIKWNLSEENDFSQSKLEDFADYLTDQDPYDHPVSFHTHMLSSSGSFSDYSNVLGDERFSMTSIQCQPDDVGDIVERWREDSADTDQPWVIDVDEIGPATVGLTEDNASDLRKRSLWDVYFSGGNIEWYFGYSASTGGDLDVEDMRSREDMWAYTWYARKFIEDLPFVEMVARDELVTGEGQNHGGAEVFGKRNEVYAIYFPDTSSTGSINLTETPSFTFERRWYNPRTGNFSGGTAQVTGGQVINNGSPPSSGSSVDWVLLYQKL